jgi:uncharacterized protein YqgV (UPF0045/DUF77 family)
MTTTVTAQISVYPLRQASLTPTVDIVREALEAADLHAEVGTMSTFVTGSSEEIFLALREGFERADTMGDVVMTVTISNACSK